MIDSSRKFIEWNVLRAFYLYFELLITGIPTKCGFTQLQYLIKDEGVNLESSRVSYNECKWKCFAEKECNSFSYCSNVILQGDCHLKGKDVDLSVQGRLPFGKRNCKTTYLVSCKGKILITQNL